MITITLLIVVVTLLLYVIYWAREVNQHWKSRGIKHRKPALLMGNILPTYLEKKHVSIIYEEICREYPNEPIIGFYEFTNPLLLVTDADYVEKVLIKDFANFIDHGFEINEEKNPIDAQLFSMVGKRWRAFRYKLSPIFTSGKLKSMFESMTEGAEDLGEYLNKSNKKEIDMKMLMSRLTMDLLGPSVFGINPKAIENPNSKFCKLATDIFTFGFFGSLRFAFMLVSPKLSRKLGISFNNPETVKYFCKILQDTFEYRKKNNIQRNDFIQLLMALKEKQKIEIQNWDPSDDYLKDSEIPTDCNSYEITDNVLMAQAYSFLVNGLDALAIIEAFAFFELSQKPEIQNKAIAEIREQINQHKGFTYEALKNMTYLEKIVKETLRLYPAGAHLFRLCNREYTFPNGFTIKKGETLRIPVTVIHKNPNYFPEPEVFKPERFDDPPRPGTYLPFGDGPRVCIAMRYALLIMKFSIAKILSKYKIKLNPKTKLPICLKPNSILHAPEDPFLFDLEPIN